MNDAEKKELEEYEIPDNNLQCYRRLPPHLYEPIIKCVTNYDEFVSISSDVETRQVKSYVGTGIIEKDSLDEET